MTRKDNHHRQTAAIMFTDMVGYTVLAQRNERLALRLLEEHRRFLRSIFPTHQGQEIKTMGDGFLVRFHSALAAVRCAIEIQKRLARQNATGKAGGQFQLRIGIHLGEVVHREGDLFGEGVNLAARLEPMAEPGGICFSQQVFDQVRRAITQPIACLEKVELKHVTRPVDLYRISLGKPLPSAAPPSKPVEKKSVAVLPFVNMTPERENEFLSDGITEDLITALSQVKGLRVPASTSVFALKGKHEDIRKIGAQLCVATVLEGSVRRSGKQLRVTAKLINVADGYNLWSERFEREIEDVFAIQDEISRAIVQALKVRLVGEAESPLVKRPTESTDAYQLYRKGRHYWTQRGEGLNKGLHYFELALLEDPHYALAHAGVADSYILLGYYGHLSPKEAFPKAKAAALRSLALNDTLAEGHCSLGYVNFLYDWDTEASEKEFKQAVALSPGYITAHYWSSSCLLAMGRNEEALAGDYRALEKDPISVLTNAHYAWTLVGLRQYEKAMGQLQKTLSMFPLFPIAHRLLGQCYVHLGRHTDAIDTFQHAVRLSKGNPSMLAWWVYACGLAGRTADAEKALAELRERAKTVHVRAFLFALAEAGLGRKEAVFRSLEEAYEEHDFWMQWLAGDAAFDFLHEDPRFSELLKRVVAKRSHAPVRSKPHASATATAVASAAPAAA
ncbi:MAG TPA: adenylate/guanylate cyclase domain-containing protein [Candidatus Saccharimonadales bacterium]|nr:adenylate/guanylate cyclase domain-containing protein [Candidatus Saccharimonadales bacterium]